MHAQARFRRGLAYAFLFALLPAAAFASSLEDALDRTSDPCQDFYQFACGGWLKAHPLPGDLPRYGRFDELQERNQETLRAILETASAGGASRNAVDQKIGDYYAACMDEPAIEKLGLRPVKPTLDRIAALRDRKALPTLLAELHRQGVDAFFSFSSEQDFKEPTAVIAIADQGGIALPERDYYLRDDAKTAEQRQKYGAHLANVFALAGEKDAKTAARMVLEIETTLARASLDVVTRRDPEKLYHKTTRAALQAMTPRFDWTVYLRTVKAPAVASLNVVVPDFLEAFDGIIVTTPLPALRTYLRWQVLHAAAPLLPPAFVAETFDFFGRTLEGSREMRPRWKRCVSFTDDDLGDALGQRYVEKTFGTEGRERMQAMVERLEGALGRDIRELPWMTEATKAKALDKLAAVRNKIGYPEKWVDYSSLAVRRDDAFGNSLRSNAFALDRELAKIGKPLDRGEWDMSPPTVNANYNPLRNDINFPAGILQPPFFDLSADDAVNYAATGGVIGHELTHGFDDQGRQFAADGSLQDWWTERDAAEFEERTRCLVDQYSGYSAIAGEVKLNGKLTLGENVADHGGLRIARLALQSAPAEASRGSVAGFSREQLFFLGWGQIWCENKTDEFARLLAQVDPHSPGAYRVNGVVSSMEEFARAFGCKAGSPMVRENACRVW